MKRLLYIALIIGSLVLLVLCILPKSNVNRNEAVELILIYDKQNIRVVLPNDEAEKIIDILDGNFFDLFSGVPACGFTENYALKIGDNFYAVAIDSCNTIMDCSSERYFYISQEELNYIHDLFEKYDY